MSCSLSFGIPKALPFLDHKPSSRTLLSVVSFSSKQRQTNINHNSNRTIKDIIVKPIAFFRRKSVGLAIEVGAILFTAAQPALALTVAKDGEDLTWLLIQAGVSAFFYFIVCPPIIMNWLRIRWYRRNVYEMFLQFMFIFLFYPGVLLWTPLLNFRKLPRDPSMKHPWSTPENPSQIRSIYRKFPWAQPEDYDY